MRKIIGEQRVIFLIIIHWKIIEIDLYISREIRNRFVFGEFNNPEIGRLKILFFEYSCGKVFELKSIKIKYDNNQSALCQCFKILSFV